MFAIKVLARLALFLGISRRLIAGLMLGAIVLAFGGAQPGSAQDAAGGAPTDRRVLIQAPPLAMAR